ncbi:hypothetical protein [Elizabethkingia anophelis]|uniref:hypothetical protein n=1 Tax=Elizabethkingia anophelis TaxID=1117645 RepID=UPI003891925C
MKKLLLFLTLSTIFINAQSFKIESGGFVNSEDSNKNFIVLDFPNKTQSELFNATKKYLQKEISDARAFSFTDNEQIVVHYTDKGAIRRADYNYKDVYVFKDGKIKYEPSLNFERSTIYQTYTNPHIINADLKNKKTNEALEKYLNTKVILIKQGIQKELTDNNF